MFSELPPPATSYTLPHFRRISGSFPGPYSFNRSVLGFPGITLATLPNIFVAPDTQLHAYYPLYFIGLATTVNITGGSGFINLIIAPSTSSASVLNIATPNPTTVNNSYFGGVNFPGSTPYALSVTGNLSLFLTAEATVGTFVGTITNIIYDAMIASDFT